MAIGNRHAMSSSLRPSIFFDRLLFCFFVASPPISSGKESPLGSTLSSHQISYLICQGLLALLRSCFVGRKFRTAGKNELTCWLLDISGIWFTTKPMSLRTKWSAQCVADFVFPGCPDGHDIFFSSNRFIPFKDLLRWRIFALLTMASPSSAFRMVGMSNQGRHPIVLIMYYLSAASLKPANNFVSFFSFFFFLSLAVGLCVVNVGFGFPLFPPAPLRTKCSADCVIFMRVFFSPLRVIYSYS